MKVIRKQKQQQQQPTKLIIHHDYSRNAVQKNKILNYMYVI